MGDKNIIIFMYYVEVNGIEKQFDTVEEVYLYCDELDEKGLDFETFEDCEHCNGKVTGYKLVTYCSKPVSECCGGCTEKYYCEECVDGKQPLLL